MKATFGAGCFWHVEDLFSKTPGVKSTAVGYTGGSIPHPTYENVCTDRTGHAEAVEVDYDPEAVSFEDLLDIFWQNHNPTTLNRQGPDRGTQYRSAVFYHNPEQQEAAEASKRRLEGSNRYSRPIVTAIVPVTSFYRAEEYHQKYFKKHGLS